MAEERAGREAERQVGPYILRERTARRLVAERTGTPHVSLIAVGVVFLLLVVAIAPWRGGTRVPIAISLTGVALAIGFLIAGFVPRLERLTVDVETRECSLEQVYLLARRTRILRIPLDRVGAVHCRRRVWQEAPDTTVLRWSVELVGDGKTWLLAEDEQEEPMQELARLVAEVAGIPRRSLWREVNDETGRETHRRSG
jgi:hypothetical protein